MKFGQFCPIAKATELLGEKWTLLILRELLMGSTRFNELQKGLSFISPTVLTRRLATLEENGLLAKRKIQGQRGFEYFPTEATEELLPIILRLGDWGTRWARRYLTDEDYDVDFLMLYLKRSIVPTQIPGRNAVIKFKFLDIEDNPNWWILVADEEIDICVKDPGKDVDVFFTTTVKTMSQVWLGHRTYSEAIRSEELLVVGARPLTREITRWLSCSPFSPTDA